MIEKNISLVIEKKVNISGKYYVDGIPHGTDIVGMLEGLLKESRTAKQEVFVNFLGLSKCTLIVCNILYRFGYVPLSDVTKAEMHVKDYRYRITKNQTYYIQVKTGYKSFVTLQCVEPVIGLKQMPQTKEEAEKDLELYHYVRDSFLAGKKRSENRILYSSASISRTLFNSKNHDFAKSARLQGHITIGDKKYKRGYFCEKYNRPGTHGGMCYVSEKGYKYNGPGIVLDVNSLYDYVMCNTPMPTSALLKIGVGTMPKRYLNRKLYYTVQKVTVSASLKKDGVACIVADNSRGNEYMTHMCKRNLTLNQADRDLLFDNYNITYYRIKSYIVYQAGNSAYKKYIEPLYKQKKTLKKGIQRDYVKMCLVGFIGTFARKIHKMDYILNSTDDEVLYGVNEPVSAEEYDDRLNKSDGLCYINNAVVSAGKKYIISYIKKHQGRFLYTDTDSIHLSGTEIPEDIPISDEMGDFKVEHTYTECAYHWQKEYCIKEDGIVKPTIAGTPKDTKFDAVSDPFTKNYNIKLISESVEDCDVSYREEPRKCEEKVKTHEQRVQEEADEWIDNNRTMPKIWQHYRDMRREKEREEERENQMILKQIDDLLGTHLSVFTNCI